MGKSFAFDEERDLKICMDVMKDKSSSPASASDAPPRAALIYMTVIALALLPWIVFDSHYLVRQDVAWLMLAAMRLLQGESLLTHFYEINPPLIILLFTLPAGFAQITGLPVYFMPFYFCLAGALGTTWLVYRVLASDRCLSFSARWIITAGFLIGCTIFTGYETAQREHLIMMGLTPMLLCQYFLMRKIRVPQGLVLACCILGSVAALLKPHFGLLPVLLLCARLRSDKTLKFWRYADFLCLALTTLLYVVVCVVAFPDYITVVLPDVPLLYFSFANSPAETISAALALVVLTAGLFACTRLIPAFSSQHAKSLFHFFLVMALLSLIPPLVQMKGFFYHFLPAMCFLFIAAAMTVSGFAEQIAGHRKLFSCLFTFLAAIFIAYAWHPLNPLFPKHDDYRQLPFSQVLEKYAPGQAYMVLWDNIGFSNSPPLYGKNSYGSRFTSLYFYPAFAIVRAQGHGTDPRIEALKEKYRRLVVEDFKRFQPALVAVPEMDETWPTALRDYPQLDYLRESKDFSDLWDRYKLKDSVVISRDVYFEGIDPEASARKTTFDIYILEK